MEFNLSKPAAAKKIELSPDKLYDTLIIGTGPAGLNAALYLRRKGLEVGLIGRQAGGQVANTSVVENYLGYKNIPGIGLVEDFERHVKELEVPILEYYGVTGVKRNEDSSFSLDVEDGKTYQANSLIIASGSSNRKLGVPGEKEFYGRGVTYCAICDGPLYNGKKVLVAGGGNSAVEAAIDLAKISPEVVIVHRSKFRADQILLDKMKTLPNIKVHLETQIQSINGDMGVDSVTTLDKNTQEVMEIPVEGIFVEIGYIPNTDIFKRFVDLTPGGEIIVDENGATNVPGVYAAGDVTTVRYKQIIIAAAQGASSALALNDWYMTHSTK